MHILFVSLLKRKITPDVKSSRPRIIYELIQGLLKKGHTVDVLGTGDSVIPGARIIPILPTDWVSMPQYENQFYAETASLTLLADKIREIGNDYDIIHNHTYPEFINLLIADQIKTPIITTIHAQGFELLDETLAKFDKSYLISLSKAHRSLFKKTNIFRIVYNGIDTDLYKFNGEKKGYLLWLGRLAKAKNEDGSFADPKGIKWAIRLAEETNHELLMSGNIEDINFFENDVKPHLSDKIRWIGPASSELALEKQEVVKLMQNAKCFLMTVNWFEPFGLVMAEAMSCGTPVIGFDRGAVPEVIADGKTGFVVPYDEGIDSLKKALGKIDTIKPSECRAHVEQHFSNKIMVEEYEKIYKDVISKNK
ncbi:hypothetical protein A3A93_05510 [Candidatus Roizmanbacteria bacterium RIFCSPLOWO2_01_FULL_38_12]|uniref:Glycosyl transferase family 1 domain-containing protein n=1 Tax=Candidatus Roizmanbacteria bacterium RIFCSPLOWO2_01_FULL_38_12 TaxID=1802061 RepID=A0A1F7IZ59_9BACT|nr:MAG: hypothetical protein A2861_03730 [Candidatus Roizmanbacteria bacterium RIFCSPHIGHO2_01_FULL_38_15]OGK35245.1 MAG: hypothetical protein A3F59_06300 [Candidatus Roizmanbacteria bacterium RIFCSPHIGHO2_12_FULL_38_13]OGK48644.1 MAG: hypothetical protein A3A93_05510 [Candidatus Roizmanbacteria bacterium RIFCSPLOWO2_01_FULL_38_12]